MRDPYRLELQQLRTATAIYLDLVRDVAPVLVGIDEFGGLYDELGYALRPDEQGTPAAIDRALCELLQEGAVRRLVEPQIVQRDAEVPGEPLGLAVGRAVSAEFPPAERGRVDAEPVGHFLDGERVGVALQEGGPDLANAIHRAPGYGRSAP